MEAVRPRSWFARPTLLVVALSLVLVAQGLLRGWGPVDDAYISFRFARNLATGHGLVFNPAERVEGYTNFLWTVVLAGASRLGADLPAVSVVLGLALAGVTLELTRRLAANVARQRGWPPGAAWIPVVLLVAYPGWCYWAFSGMESMLLAALTTGLLLVGGQPLLSTRRAIAAGLLAAAAAMTRWEAGLLWPLLVAAMLADRSVPRRSRLARAALATGALLMLFGTYFAWRYAYYGDPMPNTYYAKVGGPLLQRLTRGLLYSGELGVNWLIPLTFLAWILGPLGRWTLVLAGTLVIQGLYVTWTGGDFFPWLRFYVQILPVAAILAAALIESCTRRFAPSRQSRARIGLTVVTGAVILAVAWRLDDRNAREHVRLVAHWKNVAEWVNRSVPEGDTLLLTAVGIIGYDTNRPVLDMLGLVDREIARTGQFDPSEAVGHQKSDVASVLRRRPDVVIGEALAFAEPPTQEEVLARTRRRAMAWLLRTPQFQALYRYEVARMGDAWTAYWVLREPRRAAAPATGS